MQPLAADLAPEDMRELADYYAGLPHPQMPSTSETWRWWSGGGNWSSKVCQARTYRLARHATAMSGPEPRGPRSTTTGADDEERSDQKSGEGTAEPGAESLARSLGEGTHAPLSRLRLRLWHSFADPSGWDADGPQKPRPCLCL
jgi:hypothetical protein